MSENDNDNPEADAAKQAAKEERRRAHMQHLREYAERERPLTIAELQTLLQSEVDRWLAAHGAHSHGTFPGQQPSRGLSNFVDELAAKYWPKAELAQLARTEDPELRERFEQQMLALRAADPSLAYVTADDVARIPKGHKERFAQIARHRNLRYDMTPESQALPEGAKLILQDGTVITNHTAAQAIVEARTRWADLCADPELVSAVRDLLGAVRPAMPAEVTCGVYRKRLRDLFALDTVEPTFIVSLCRSFHERSHAVERPSDTAKQEHTATARREWSQFESAAAELADGTSL